MYIVERDDRLSVEDKEKVESAIKALNLLKVVKENRSKFRDSYMALTGICNVDSIFLKGSPYKLQSIKVTCFIYAKIELHVINTMTKRRSVIYYTTNLEGVDKFCQEFIPVEQDVSYIFPNISGEQAAEEWIESCLWKRVKPKIDIDAIDEKYSDVNELIESIKERYKEGGDF